MPNYRRLWVPGGTFFFTVVSYRRQPVLCDPPVRAALRKAIAVARRKHPFTINAWVLLPDHLHCLWTLPPGDADYATRWAIIKRHTSLACRDTHRRVEWLTTSRQKHRESTLWQRRYWEHQVRDETDFIRRADYLHYNPVKHGLVQRVADWPYSTFHREVQRGIYPADWAEDPSKPGNPPDLPVGE